VGISLATKLGQAHERCTNQIVMSPNSLAGRAGLGQVLNLAR
jgi:hypothetical protein